MKYKITTTTLRLLHPHQNLLGTSLLRIIDLLWFHSSDYIGNQGSDQTSTHLIWRISFEWEISKVSCVLISAQPEISFLVVVVPHLFLLFQWHVFLATSNRVKVVSRTQEIMVFLIQD